MEEIY